MRLSLLSVAGGLALFLLLYSILGSVQGLILGAVFFAIAVYLLESLGEQRETPQGQGGSSPGSLWPIVFVTSYLLFIFGLFLVQSVRAGLFLDPLSISPENWFRWASALMLTTFYPGYAILHLIDRKGVLGAIPRLLFSYVISMTLTALVAFSILNSGGGIEQGNSRLLLIYLSLPLLSVYVAVGVKDGSLLARIRKPSSNRLASSSSLFLTLVSVALVLALFSTDGSQIMADQRVHHGLALILSHGFPQVQGIAEGGPWFFDGYGAVLNALSGIPSINVYNLLGILEIVPLLGFYYMVKSLIKDKFSSEISTVLAFFTSGFGWVYVLYVGSGAGSVTAAIYDAWLKTYDIMTPSTFLLAAHPDIATPLQLTALVGGPLLFALAYVPEVKGLGRLRTLLFTITAFFSCMGHPEAVVFIATILLTLPFVRDGWKLGASLTVAALCVLVVDLLSPGRYYIVAPPFIELFGIRVGLLGLLLVSSVIVTVLCAAVQRTGSRIAVSLRRLRDMFPTKVASATLAVISLIALATYLLSFVVWSNLPSSYSTRLTFSVNGSVPWFVYPLRFGVVEFLALCGSIYLLLTRRTSTLRTFLPFYLLMFVSILVSPYYLEYRMDKYVYLGLSVIAGYSAAALGLRLSRTRIHVKLGSRFQGIRSVDGRKVAGVVLIAILVTSLPSEVYFLQVERGLVNMNDGSTASLEVASVLGGRTPPDVEQMAALSWLSQNINPLTDGVVVLPSTMYSNNYNSEATTVIGYAGAWDVQSERYLPIFQVTDPANFFELANSIQPKYIYVTSEDLQTLASNPLYTDSYLKEMVSQFPVAYNNSEVTIYRIPRVSPPSKNSAVGVLPEISDTEFTSLAMGGLNYTVVTNSNYNLSSIKTLILGQPPPGGLLDDLLGWVRAGGNLISLYYMNESSVFAVHNGTITGLRTGSPSLVALQNGTLAASGGGYAIFDKNATRQFVLSGEVEALTPTSTDNHLGLIFDYKNSSDYYYLFERSNSLVLYKMYKGHGLEVYYDPNFVRQSGFHDLEVKSNPPFLTFSVDGTTVGQYNDSSPLVGGFVGYQWYNLASRFGKMVLSNSAANGYRAANGASFGGIQSAVENLTVPYLSHSPGNSSKVSYFTENGKPVSIAAFSQPMGRGTVTYVNLPISVSSYSTPLTTIWEILEAIGVGLPTTQSLDSSPAPLTQPFDYVGGAINMSGTVSVLSDYLTASWAGLNVESNDTAVGGTLDNISVGDFTRMNVTSSFGTVLPDTAVGSYPVIELATPATLTIDLGKSVPLVITTTNGQGDVRTVSMHGGELTLRLSNPTGVMKVVAQTPLILTNGTVKMAYAAIGSENATGGVGPLTTTGHSRFEVTSVDDGIIRLSGFGASGQLEFQPPAQKLWNEWNIPWTTNAILEYAFVVLWLCLVTMYLSGVLLADPIQSPTMRREEAS